MKGLPIGLPASLAIWFVLFGQWRYALAFACMTLGVYWLRAFYFSIRRPVL